MNYNEMSAAQCADWLAEKDGWTFKYNLWWHPTIMASFHPYQLTLDAAAGALPASWALAKVTHYGPLWSCQIERFKPTCERLIVDSPDELTARYRAAVAARMEE